MPASITFNGSAREVGRSNLLVNTGKGRVMLDCGIKFRGDDAIAPKFIDADALIVGHTHLDHIGFAPGLYREGFKGPSYLTGLTSEIGKIQLRDFIKVSRVQNRTFYGTDDLKSFERHSETVDYGSQWGVLPKVKAEFYDAGHVPGAASVVLDFGKRLLYTGDIKTTDTRLLDGANTSWKDIDYLIIESTYADREHEDRGEIEKRFVRKICEVTDNGGVVVAPVFAVGRAQEVLCLLNAYKIGAPIYLDGIAKRISALVSEREMKGTDSLRRELEEVIFVNRRGKMDFDGSVIVTTAGMLQGGPVVDYVQRFGFDEGNAILLTGYQVDGTPGSELLKSGKFMGKKVKAEVGQFDLSAHSGGRELFEIVEKTNPEKVFCVHGDERVCIGFARELKRDGYDAVAPKLGDEFLL